MPKDHEMVPQTRTLANARLILPGGELLGRISFRGGEIVEIAKGDAVPAGAVDCGGDIVTAGLVELHTDNLERHIRPRPSANWPHMAAIVAHDAELAACGITTVFDAIRVGSIEGKGGMGWSRYARQVATELLGLRASGSLKISHHIHLRAEMCSHSLVDELAEFGPDDRIGILSLMDHTPGQRQFADIGQYRTYMTGKHGMSEQTFAEHVETRQSLGERVRDTHERAAVEAAQRFGAVLASHDDTTAGHVARSASHGIALAEFPTTEEAARACRQHGIAVMMGAPNLIRGGSHSGQRIGGATGRGGSAGHRVVRLRALGAALFRREAGGDVARLAAGHGHCQHGAGAGGGPDGPRAVGRGAARRPGPLPHRGRRAVLHGVWSAGHRVA
jgi:alpha-D-ribose 1-methylphosphonate 5-triphosphate diphosphatase